MAELEYTVQSVAVTPTEKRGRRDYAKHTRSKAGLDRPNSTEASKRSQHMKKVRAFMLLGGKCYNCGDNRMQALEFDHLNGNGSKERQEIGRGATMTQEVLKRPFDFQILCGSCHNLKTSNVEQAVADFKKD
jgi:5-methylcytosine-specific restriction endonuclease McrA